MRYTNSYNVHKAFLNLKSMELQNSILFTLRKPDIFIESYQLSQGGERGENIRKVIEFGFHSLIDNIGVSVMHKKWPGKTALKFLNLLTDDNYNEKENAQTTLYFTMVIYADIMTLHNSLKESIKKLKLD